MRNILEVTSRNENRQTVPLLFGDIDVELVLLNFNLGVEIVPSVGLVLNSITISIRKKDKRIDHSHSLNLTP